MLLRKKDKEILKIVVVFFTFNIILERFCITLRLNRSSRRDEPVKLFFAFERKSSFFTNAAATCSERHTYKTFLSIALCFEYRQPSVFAALVIVAFTTTGRPCYSR